MKTPNPNVVAPFTLIAFCAIFLVACSGHREERDSAPDQVMDWQRVPDAVPKWEPKARYGNHSPYKVFGRQYRVMASAEGYSATGVASWYGKKFTGRPTSSQEPYDPYAMTAAHRSLPLPTYVRVTNLANQQSIVVKVNDRGPFHDNRLIDLSYAAAHKLGFAEQGITKVKVEAITPPNPQQLASGHQFYLQAGAFRDINRAAALKQSLLELTTTPVHIKSPTADQGSRFHRVRIGPFSDDKAAKKLQQTIREAQLADPLLIKH